MNPFLLKLAAQSLMIVPKQKRANLPRASDLEKLSDRNREAVFRLHRRHLEEVVCRVVLTTDIGRRGFLKFARDRMKRLERLEEAHIY